MKKYLILIIFILIPISFVSAHPGNKDRFGGHTCYTNCAHYGLSYGQYHFDNPSKIIPPTQNNLNNPYTGWHGINYQGDCYSYEWYYSVYDSNAKKYFSSTEYLKEKEIWREKLKTKNGDSLKNMGVSYDSFVANYESDILSATTNLDDTDCFMPFQKLSDYVTSQIQVYNTEQDSLKSGIKRIFSWF